MSTSLVALESQIQKIWREHYVNQVRRFDWKADPQCYFHLKPCHRCGAPSWQQPCPWCDFYPQGNQDWQNAAQQRKENPLSFERFKKVVEQHGNFAAFYFIYESKHKWIPEGAISAAQALTDCPTAEEIWIAVTGVSP